MLPKKRQAVLLVLLLVSCTNAYDNGLIPCWDIRLAEGAFCKDSVNYKLSTPTFYDQDNLDKQAHDWYSKLLAKWEEKGKGAPSNDCLAIARDFYCYNAFGRCKDND